ncbi:MAG: 4Fe-4S binding protein, partial [Candidatus Cloacimonadaceae bacterium]|nr:4Fe-4S binding protein [Candidatus Cloacimonadaceae bacterium]
VTITEYNVDASSCNGCGECIRVCPSDAIYYDANNKAVIDQSKCTHCTQCVIACPNNAIY